MYSTYVGTVLAGDMILAFTERRNSVSTIGDNILAGTLEQFSRGQDLRILPGTANQKFSFH